MSKFVFSYTSDSNNDSVFIKELTYGDYKSLLKIILNKDYLALDFFIDSLIDNPTSAANLDIRDRLSILIELKQLFIGGDLQITKNNSTFNIDLNQIRRNINSFAQCDDLVLSEDGMDIRFNLPLKLNDVADMNIFKLFQGCTLKDKYSSRQCYNFGEVGSIKDGLKTEEYKKLSDFFETLKTNFSFPIHDALDFNINLSENALKFVELLLLEDYGQLIQGEYNLKKAFNYSLDELNSLTYQEYKLLTKFIISDVQKEAARQKEQEAEPKIPLMYAK